ncbi:MAG: diadenylate cyclase [Planctomycetota bacterium]
MAFLAWIAENWRWIVEIVLIAVGFYFMLRFMQGTRGAGILKGLAVLVVVFIALAFFAQIQWLDFGVIRRLMEGFFTVLMFGLIVLFQPELRRALIRLGENPLLGLGARSRRASIDHVVNACQSLAAAGTGALIAIQRAGGLGTFAEGGVRLDARLSAKLLTTIFRPGTALHDGAVVIAGDTIVAASCLFPLTENPEVDNTLYGTRHRAGIGLSEESDAFVIVISEETHEVSTCFKGAIRKEPDMDHLRERLEELCFRDELLHTKPFGPEEGTV